MLPQVGIFNAEGWGVGGGGSKLLTLREDKKPCAQLVASSTAGSRVLLKRFFDRTVPSHKNAG